MIEVKTYYRLQSELESVAVQTWEKDSHFYYTLYHADLDTIKTAYKESLGHLKTIGRDSKGNWVDVKLKRLRHE